MKLIDFDALFDRKLEQYMKENAGKYTEGQWETLIPKLYKNFGDTFVKSAGATPLEYYAKMTDEALCETLKEHIAQEVPVSDFLARELESRNCPDALSALIKSDDESLSLAAISVAGEGERANALFFEILTKDSPSAVKELVAEKLRTQDAEPFKERALDCYKRGIAKEYMIELLCRCEKDDRIFGVLMDELKELDANIPVLAGEIARYGDERAVEFLVERIDREETTFCEYQELICAIEALGGEYTEERDFSLDKDYQIIKSASLKEEEK